MWGMVRLCQSCLRPAIADTPSTVWELVDAQGVSATQQMCVHDPVEEIERLIVRGGSAGRQLLPAPTGSPWSSEQFAGGR
jgi:hypothetical protein